MDEITVDIVLNTIDVTVDVQGPDTIHTHVASEITDFDTEVANNSAVVANTAKVGVTSEEANPDVVPQAEAEAGVATTERIWTAERVGQAIAALAAGGASLNKTENQVSHGFSTGNAIRHNGTIWVKAQADSISNAGTLGIVSEVTDVDNFVYTFGSLLSVGTWTDGVGYFLSPSVAGAIITEPIYSVGEVREFIGTGTPDGLLLEIDLGDEITELTGNGYLESFTSQTSLTVTHNLNTLTPIVEIWNDTNVKIEAASITVVDADSITVVFGSATTGRLVVGGGIKTAVGVPSGGTATQKLVKATGNDYDTEWVDDAGGGVTQDAGQTLTFTTDTIYNGATYLTSGNLTLSLTSAVDGVVAICYCDSYIPTISGVDYYISSGSFDANSLNVLSFLYDGNEIYLNIGQVVILSAPTLTLTPADTQMQVDWGTIPSADNYVIEQADDSGFTTNLTEIYNGALLTVTKTGLTNGVTYYYRGKSEGAGFTSSAWSATASGSPAVASTDYTTNLIASYALESDGADYTTNHNLTLLNTPTFASAKVGNGMTLNGTNQQGAASDHNDFSFTNGSGTDLSFSLALWLYFDDFTGIEDIIGKYNTTTTAEWLINKNGVDLQFLLMSEGDGSVFLRETYDMTALSTATWYHFVFTYDGSKSNAGMKIYKDKVLLTTTTANAGSYVQMDNATEPMRIGSRLGTTNWFAGRVDEAHIWKTRELPLAEVEEMYDLEVAGTSILP